MAARRFMPNGFGGAVIAGMLVTMFSFMGTEIVTIAAAESPDPTTGISKAVNSVIWRISLFYIGSIFVIVALMPYDKLDNGSYQTTLEAIGIPGSKIIMDLVILTAVASCLNSALYTASRMLFSLGDRRDAPPRVVRKLTGNGVPWVAVLASMVVGVSGRRRQLPATGEDLRLPAGDQWRDRPVRLPGHRGQPVRPGPRHAGQGRGGAGQDVAVPLPDGRRDGGHRRGVGAHGIRSRPAVGDLPVLISAVFIVGAGVVVHRRRGHRMSDSRL